MNTGDLIDVIRVLHELDSDGKAGKLIGASRQEMSNWRRGYQQPTAYHRSRIATATDMTREEVDAIIELQREKNPERLAYWKKVLTSAAIVILTVVASTFLPSVESSIMLPNELLASALLFTNVDIMRICLSCAVLAYILYGYGIPIINKKEN